MPKSFEDDKAVSDALLIRRLRVGRDTRAFTCLYDRYNRFLYAIAYRYIKDTDTVEDIVQQVFMKLWESRAILQEDMNIRNFLYTMAKNRVLNEIRNNTAAMMKNYELMSQKPVADDMERQVEDREMVAAFRRFMDQLPPRQRQVCSYRLEDGLPTADVAQRMGISVSTVKTLYQIGMKTVRLKMKKLMLAFLAALLFYMIFPTD